VMLFAYKRASPTLETHRSDNVKDLRLAVWASRGEVAIVLNQK
jgi:hypothetical protein